MESRDCHSCRKQCQVQCHPCVCSYALCFDCFARTLFTEDAGLRRCLRCNRSVADASTCRSLFNERVTPIKSTTRALSESDNCSSFHIEEVTERTKSVSSRRSPSAKTFRSGDSSRHRATSTASSFYSDFSEDESVRSHRGRKAVDRHRLAWTDVQQLPSEALTSPRKKHRMKSRERFQDESFLVVQIDTDEDASRSRRSSKGRRLPRSNTSRKADSTLTTDALAQRRFASLRILDVEGLPDWALNDLSSFDWFGKYGKLQKIIVKGQEGGCLACVVSYVNADSGRLAIRDMNRAVMRFDKTQTYKISCKPALLKFCPNYLSGTLCHDSTCCNVHGGNDSEIREVPKDSMTSDEFISALVAEVTQKTPEARVCGKNDDDVRAMLSAGRQVLVDPAILDEVNEGAHINTGKNVLIV